MCDVTLKMVTVTCCSCDEVFQMTESRNRALRTTGDVFTCPNGHRQHYTDSELSMLKKQISQLEERLKNMTASKEYWYESHGRAMNDNRRMERRYNGLLGAMARLKRKLGVGHGA